MTGMEILYNLWILLKEELEKKDIILTDKDENLWERLWKDNNVETSGIMNEDGSFHSEITMALTMGYVFGWYVKNHPIEKWKDIMEILAGEWIEWRIVCMTGRLMRCVNLLSGIHPEFKVEVPIGEQIQQKYNYLYKRYAHRFPEDGWLENPERILRYYNESIFLWKDFASHFREALEEINVNEEVIQEWILPLEENAKDLEDEMKEKYPDEYNKLLEKWETERENAFYSQRDY